MVIGGGPEAGPYNHRGFPYQKEILDSCGDPTVRRVVMMCASQVGKTILQGVVAGYYMAAEPSRILAVLPSNSGARKWNYSKLEPSIMATPILRNLITEHSILKKIFPGGFLVLCGAMSTDAFRMLDVRVLLLDELDAWPATIADEGSPLSLARGRTTVYWDSKEILVSTPTTVDTSLIYPEYLAGDQRKFYVPCPECGQYQVLNWKAIGYTNDDPKTAHFKCQFNDESIADEEFRDDNFYYAKDAELKSCGAKVSEAKKLHMLREGKWVAHNPEAEYPSYWLPVTYSPRFSWEQLVREWVAIRTIDQRKSFIQTRLAQPWEERTDKVESHELIARLETYKSPCPAGVGFLIGAIDVQKDRLEATVWGFSKDEECWCLDHQIFYGPVYQDTAFNQLAKFVDTASYPNAYGARAKVNAWAIDTGYSTENVYPFLKHMTMLGVSIYGVKGSSKVKQQPAPDRPYVNKAFKVNVWELGVNSIKDILITRMVEEPPGPGTLHLPLSVDGEFLNQLTAEQRVRETNKKTGEVRMYWKKIGPRNEILDCYVYAYGVYLMHFKSKNVDVEKAIEVISNTKAAEPVVEKKKPDNQIELQMPTFKAERKRNLPGNGSWYQGFGRK